MASTKWMTKLQDQRDKFNETYPIGTKVYLKKDFVDEPVATKLTHKAFILSGHSVVAFFEGISGCYRTDCVRGEMET